MSIMSEWSIPIFMKTKVYFPENLIFVIFWLLNTVFHTFCHD